MASFPRIQRACPYLDQLDAVIDRGFCHMCRRDVHDLTAMDEPQRADFLAGCGDACVSYTTHVKPAVAAALIAASAAVLVAPDATLATHPARRGRDQHHRLEALRVPTVLIRTAGLFAAPPEVQAKPHPPAEQTLPAKKPD